MAKTKVKSKKVAMADGSTRKKQKKHGALYYAMPWNLRREIATLGYDFNTKMIVGIYAAIIAAIVGLGIAFKMDWPYVVVLLVAGLLISPTFVRNSYKNKWEKKRFSDVNVYIEQMLYAFSNSQKVLTALMDVEILFPKGSAMREVISRAIDTISNPLSVQSGEDVERAALDIIEERYDNAHLKSMHRFILSVENIGGDFSSSTKLLLDDRSMWENRMLKLQDKRRAKRSEILGSCVASVFLCLVMLYILPAQADISKMMPVEICNTVVIISMFLVYLKADRKLSSNLLAEHEDHSPEKTIADYHKYLNYDKKAGFKTSLKFAVVPVVGLIVCAFLLSGTMRTIGMVVCAILSPLMLTQHMWGHSMLGKRLRKEIMVAFPQWLMELALLLQSDNVQVAIFKTIDTALPILRPELERFRRDLVAHPDSPDPFMNFFVEFQIPEVTTSMQMLYSLSTGTGGDPDEQIANIIKRNNIVLDRAEDKANDDSMASLYTLFLMPVVLGSAVLIVDMTCFLMAFLSGVGF